MRSARALFATIGIGAVSRSAGRLRNLEESTIVSIVAFRGSGQAVLPKLAAIPIPDDVYVRSLPVRLNKIPGAATLASTPPAPAAKAFLEILKA